MSGPSNLLQLPGDEERKFFVLIGLRTSIRTRRRIVHREYVHTRCEIAITDKVMRIALVLGLCGVSSVTSAQSAVTLYGVLDTSLELTNPGNGWTTRMDSGAYRGSRFGLMGDESLGGDLHMVFRLESGFSTADGTLSQAGTLFNRQAWIGMRNDWGEFRLGRQYSPLYIPFKGQLDAFGSGTIASGLDNLSKITPYISDALTWVSPNLDGFRTTLVIALRDPSDGDGSGTAGYFLTTQYEAGPLALNYARQQTHGVDALRSNLGGASYVFGQWQAWAAFFNGEGGEPYYHAAGYALSLRYAITAAFDVSAGYTWAKDWSVADGGARQYSAAIDYTLSRALKLYASVGDLENRGASRFTLRGVNVTGLPAAYPGAPVRGIQFGLIEQF